MACYFMGCCYNIAAMFKSRAPTNGELYGVLYIAVGVLGAIFGTSFTYS